MLVCNIMYCGKCMVYLLYWQYTSTTVTRGSKVKEVLATEVEQYVCSFDFLIVELNLRVETTLTSSAVLASLTKREMP